MHAGKTLAPVAARRRRRPLGEKKEKTFSFFSPKPPAPALLVLGIFSTCYHYYVVHSLLIYNMYWIVHSRLNCQETLIPFF